MEFPTADPMTLIDGDRRQRGRLHRWLLAAVGVLLVGIGGIGVVVPGLPTTIFLIGASWCFARSCPWLEERLIRVPLFKPFLGSLDGQSQMPRRAVATTLALMWLAITISVLVISLGEGARPALAAVIVALGLVGTFFVVRLGRSRPASQCADVRGDGSSPPHR